MFNIQAKSKREKPYDKANLQRAFDATKRSGMSVYRAARLYNVPEQTLRDRTKGHISVDAKRGAGQLLTEEEEKHLVEHIKYMGDIGYGYTKGNIQHLAADFARSIKKKPVNVDSLSDNWFYGFLKRWPELKFVKPQKLQLSRAKSASKEAIDAYFMELAVVMRENGLTHSPERIYNIDETGISTEHSPPKIVCSKNSKAQSVTSQRSSNVTIIAGANAVGNYIPPFFVFPGKKWMDELLNGSPLGSAGIMTNNGWSNSYVFEKYITDHFSKHAGLYEGKEETTLVLYDGHKSHISITLTDWARKMNVVLFVLPPHSSHLTQPLDISVFGPLKAHYYRECQSYMQKNPGISISRYEVSKLTAKPYLKALCPENIIAGFRQSGIFPYNKDILSPSQLAPATIYAAENNSVQSVGCDDDNIQIDAVVDNEPVNTPLVNYSQNASTEKTLIIDNEEFFNSRKIIKALKKPKKKFVPPFAVIGNLGSDANIANLKEKSLVNRPTPSKKGKNCNKAEKALNPPCNPKPSTSGTSKKGGPISLYTPEDSDSCYSDSQSIAEEDKCCVCKLFHPKQLKGCEQLVFVKWGQCDICSHWTHLKHCSDVVVLRRDSIFKCPHCIEK